MSRSVHVTKKQLRRERWFEYTDAVPESDGVTELERRDLAKSICKINETFRRQAIRSDAPAEVKIALRENGPTRIVKARKIMG